MLEVIADAKGQKPRLVHRLDRDGGCLLVAKTRFAATALTGSFAIARRGKIYWALVPAYRSRSRAAFRPISPRTKRGR